MKSDFHKLRRGMLQLAHTGHAMPLGALLLLLGFGMLPAQTIPGEIQVSPRVSTGAVSGDADDPAIWIHPDDPALSLVIGTDKIGNFIYVWDVNGVELQRIALARTPNNGDVRKGLMLGGVPVDIYAVGVDAPSRIMVYKIDPDTRQLSDITVAGGILTPEVKEPYGFALYRRKRDGAIYAFMTSNGGVHGVLQQYHLSDNGQGRVQGVHVRSVGGDVNGQHSEGIVADDELGYVYVSEEDCCVHKFHADPDMGNQQLAEFAHGDSIEPDREGLGIYACPEGTGYLLLSSQGNQRVKVYRREGDPGNPHSHTLVTTIHTPDATSTDGLDVTSQPAGPNFPHGFLVKHHSTGKNFKLFAWEDIAQNFLTTCSITSAFSATPTSGCAPLTVNFTDQSSGPVTAWEWDFNDGTTSTEQNPTHTYNSAGVYTVMLTTTNASGYRHSYTRTTGITVGAAPSADFTAAPQTGFPPLTVAFTDQSTGHVSAWLWDFGDSTTSTLQHPTHEYARAGVYSVTLTVSDSCGSNSASKAEFITVNSPVVAAFAVSDSSGCSPLTVQFSDSSTGSPTAWLWDFGDGTNSTEQHPSHTYHASGRYTVTLTASSAVGTDTTSKSDFVIVTEQPGAAFQATRTRVSVSSPVTFTDQSSGEVSRWLWDFGDGGTSPEKNPTHHYAAPGEYTVSLTVSNECGTHTESKTNYVTVVDTISAAFSAGDTAGCAPLTVQFTDQSSGPITSRRWEFGDGTLSTESHPAHTYADTGSYTVRLTVQNAANDSSVATRTTYVRVYPVPQAEFSASVTTGHAPVLVPFTDQSAGNPTSWLWDFGDGSRSTEQHPSHTYTMAGDYTVMLTSSNACSSSTVSRTDYIHIDPCLAPVADFSALDTLGSVPMQVRFSDRSTGAPTAWSWDFGDGNSSTEQNPVHRYLAPGEYTVTLTVRNDCDSDTVSKANYVTVVDTVTADFSTGMTAGCAPLSVQFTDQSSGPVASWLWEFGDGDTSAEKDPVHTYANAGNYTVRLTVSNGAGHSHAVVKDNYISASPSPVAAFTAAPVAGNAPLTVTFTDQSTGNPTNWSWDFGDGTTSNEQHPVHTYAAAGEYTVSLTAANACGQTPATQTNLIQVQSCPPLAADFSASATSGNVPLLVNFNDLTTGNPTSWLWDFGDGNSVTEQNPTHQYTAAGTYTVTLIASDACTTDAEIKTNYITVNSVPGGNLAAGKVVTASSTASPYAAERAVDGDNTTYWRSLNTSKNTPNTWLRIDLGAAYNINRAVIRWKESYYATSYRFQISNSGGSNDTEWTTVYTNNAGRSGSQDVTFTAPFAARYFRIHMDKNNKDNNQVFELECYASAPCLPPGVNFVASATSGTAPFTVTFSDQSSGDPTSWNWDFGDGGSSTERNPSHTYNTPGDYTVKLTAGNTCGTSTGSKANYIHVAPCQPPGVNFTAAPTSGNAPLTVAFTDQSGGNPTAWRWDFGDGASATQQHPSHQYTVAGDYTVTLTATNSCGSTTKVQHNFIHVGPCVPPNAAFAASPDSGNAPLVVTFSDQSSGSPASWHWDFGDGRSAAEQNPTHTYTAAGDYTVRLIVTNQCGTDTLIAVNRVHVGPCLLPAASFTAATTSGNAPLTVSFTDRSSGSPQTWRWGFGDDSTSTQQHPTHTYQVAGDYTVKLVVSNACGSDSTIRANYIHVDPCVPPTANFSASPTSGNAPLRVDFRDESSGNPTSWSWDFGDGTSSNEQHPSHQYALAGTYTVKLTATSACNFDSETKIDYITVNSVPAGNLARGKVATAASTTTPYGTERAVDGSATSYWRSGASSKASPNQWLRIDLEGPYSLSRTVV
ncbi:MAG: phytase, partial [candidate division KSB1 bacterium]|nr:phytase [candidate division KSB1 bacterium]